MQNSKSLISGISALVLTAGVYLSSAMLPGISLAGNGPEIPGSLTGNRSPARMSSEIREILQSNNLQVAQYQTFAPEFELQDVAGKPVTLSQFRGEIVLLGFFTTW